MTSEVNLFFDQTKVSFDALLGSYSSNEFNSPSRSIVPLLSLVQHEPRMLHEILAECQTACASHLHFEFKVRPSQGVGTPSHTDMMVFSATDCLAVEAKWTEPPYETVADWLEKSNVERTPQEKANRAKVLAGWIELLDSLSARGFEDVEDCEYQMLRRAASARAAARKTGTRPQLAYFKFEPSASSTSATPDYYRSALSQFYTRLGNPTDFPFFLVEIRIAPTAKFREIEHLPKGNASTGLLVRSALTSSRLFESVNYHVVQIGKAFTPTRVA